MDNHVQVLLSTYNGEKYLRAQLDSVLGQDHPSVSLLVRDDGSTDGTVGILGEYAERHANVQYYVGENLGVIGSFFDLVGRADAASTYYAFADQDDVWLEGKLSRAASVLGEMCGEGSGEAPMALYCGKELLVDESLNPLAVSIRQGGKRPSFGNALVENIATGATCVFNQRLLLAVREHVPEFTVMHDWWFYLTAACFGRVYYDETPYLLYRQHGGNVLGSRSNYLDEFRIRFKRFGNNKGRLGRQARAFDESYRVEGRHREELDVLLYYRRRLSHRCKGLFTNRIYRQRLGDNVIFKLLFLTNHI